MTIAKIADRALTQTLLLGAMNGEPGMGQHIRLGYEILRQGSTSA